MCAESDWRKRRETSRLHSNVTLDRRIVDCAKLGLSSDWQGGCFLERGGNEVRPDLGEPKRVQRTCWRKKQRVEPQSIQPARGEPEIPSSVSAAAESESERARQTFTRKWLGAFKIATNLNWSKHWITKQHSSDPNSRSAQQLARPIVFPLSAQSRARQRASVDVTCVVLGLLPCVCKCILFGGLDE